MKTPLAFETVSHEAKGWWVWRGATCRSLDAHHRASPDTFTVPGGRGRARTSRANNARRAGFEPATRGLEVRTALFDAIREHTATCGFVRRAKSATGVVPT